MFATPTFAETNRDDWIFVRRFAVVDNLFAVKNQGEAPKTIRVASKIDIR